MARASPGGPGEAVGCGNAPFSQLESDRVKDRGNLHSPGEQLLPTQACPGCQNEVVPEACPISFRETSAAFLLLALTDCWVRMWQRCLDGSIRSSQVQSPC